MLIVLAYCHSDLIQARQLLGWIKELDPHITNHDLLLIASSRISQADIDETHNLGKSVFRNVTSIKQKVPDERPWPRASNAMFRLANDWLKQSGRSTPWLWLEADCAPMSSGWLDRLEHDYKLQAKPVYGTNYDQPRPHINGVALYPHNLAGYNNWMIHADQLPFDLVRPEVTLRHAYNSPLIQRLLADPNTNLSMTFPTVESLKAIRNGVLLAHCCKDGTLIQRLRERNGGTPEGNGHATITQKIKRIFKKSKTVSIRRSGAMGDAIAATVVANKLVEQGHKVVFQCSPAVQKVIKLCPGIKVADDTGPCDMDLNGVYESIPPEQRANKHFSEIFIEATNKALRLNLNAWNCAPKMSAPERLRDLFRSKCEKYPRPWTAIVPRSNSFANRTVLDETWETASQFIKGTTFWLGTHPGPKTPIDIQCREITQSIAAIANMDLVISIDSGPAHIAAALGIPLIVIEQASSPDVHLPEIRDWMKLSPKHLTCLNCTQLACPIDPITPPCQHLDPTEIAGAANRRLLANGVSAAIPIYRPGAAMLNRCLIHVLPQVDEVIVCVDQSGKVPDGILKHPKVRVVTSRHVDSGYGRKLNVAMRHTVHPTVLVLNDDCYLDPSAVQKSLEVLSSDPKIGVVGMLLYYPGRKLIQHGGTERTGHLGWGHVDHMKATPSILETVECENVTWAAALIRRAAFYDIGGMDERLKLYYDDNIANLKMRKNGWRVFYCPKSIADHDEHASTKITPDMESEVRRSKTIFEADWSEYFYHNADRKLGNFDYLR